MAAQDFDSNAVEEINIPEEEHDHQPAVLPQDRSLPDGKLGRFKG